MVIPKKSFGQHFLHDQAVIAKIIDAAEPEKFPLVVEVGPGTGALTSKIIDRRDGPLGRLVLIEADRELIPQLEEKYPATKIIKADAAQADYDKLTSAEPWLLIGNLPYNAASAIVMNALEAQHPPARLVVMVQKEVGERMLAVPGAMSVLSVAIGVYATVEKICLVKPGAFNPPPKVDSMVLRITTSPRPSINGGEQLHPKRVIQLAKAGFASRRKFLASNLAKAKLADAATVTAWLEEHGFSPKARAEELTVGDWLALATLVYK